MIPPRSRHPARRRSLERKLVLGTGQIRQNADIAEIVVREEPLRALI